MTPLVDADRCLLRDSALLSLSSPDAAGMLYKRANISGWYKYWFSLSGSQLLYFAKGQSARRSLLVGTISLFRHTLNVINSIKRRREFEITDQAGKVHVLRAGTDAEMHWWVQVFGIARNKIPPAKPIAHSLSEPQPDSHAELPSTIVDSHLRVEHVLCVVHGIGVSSHILSNNVTQLKESYTEIMEKVFPDVDFRVEMLVIHWREALMKLDVHKKLQAVVPQDPLGDEANPLRQFMVHRIVDYVYYTHDRYRRHIMREIASQLNQQMNRFLKRRPDFNGRISVMGHSLGAALCYDLMCRKVRDDQVMLDSEGMRLNFDASNLFCLGNPLGTFLGLDPTIGLGADMLSLPFRIYNVFKYQDPIATRLETYRDLRYLDVPPVVVPCWFNMGMRETTSQWLGALWPGQKKEEVDTPDNDNGNTSPSSTTTARALFDGSTTNGFSPMLSQSSVGNTPTADGSLRRVSSVSAELFGNESPEDAEKSEQVVLPVQEDAVRLDYALQMSSTMEEVSTSWSALKAHTDYWSNRDAMLFMVSCMMKSTFDIADDVDDKPERNVAKRIIDEDILWKRKGDSLESSDQQDEETMEVTVAQVVERLVDEVVAAHELMRLHPDVRMMSGGIAGKSPVASKTGMTGNRDSTGSGGWASYLRGGWFGGSAASESKSADVHTMVKQG